MAGTSKMYSFGTQLLTYLKDATQEDGTSPLTEMEELAIYLWENYIEYNDSPSSAVSCSNKW